MVCIQQTKYAPTWDLVWWILRLITSTDDTLLEREKISHRHGRRWKKSFGGNLLSHLFPQLFEEGFIAAWGWRTKEKLSSEKLFFFFLEVGNNLSIFFKTDCWTISNRHIFSARRLCGKIAEICRISRERDRKWEKLEWQKLDFIIDGVEMSRRAFVKQTFENQRNNELWKLKLNDWVKLLEIFKNT